MPDNPQIVYGTTVIRTELMVHAGRSVRPLRGQDNQPIVLTAACEGEPEPGFWSQTAASLETAVEKLQADLDRQAAEPKVPELAPPAPVEEPVTKLTPRRRSRSKPTPAAAPTE